MHRNRRLLIGTGAAAVVLALLATLGARAERPLGLHSLNGTYHYSVTQVRLESSPTPTTVYCNEYGRIAFDGAGTAQIVADSGYAVCSDGENPFEPNTFTYTVDPTGSVLLIEADDYTTHCQLTQKGALLLCDGTGGLGGFPNPETLTFLAVAAKL